MEEFVPAELRAFLLEYIDSVTQLEAVLLLRREGVPLLAITIAAALYVSEAVALVELSALRARGLVAVEAEGWSVLPNPKIDRLAEAYSRALKPITDILHGKPPRS